MLPSALERPVLTPLTIDMILAGIALEAIGLGFWLKSTGRTRWLLPLMLFLGSGAALMAAVRFSLSDEPSGLIPGLLLIAGVLHVLCLWQFRNR